MMRCLALDIGGTKIASAIVSGNQVTQRQQIHTPQENVVEAMHQTLAQLLSDYAGQFDYVAVASTGIINKGILTALNPKNLGGLAYFPLKQSISQHTLKPVYLLNDAQAATYAEYQLQDKNNLQNFAFITVSTGVGGGLILNHQLLTEPNGVAGHIGHTLADPNGPAILDIPLRIPMALYAVVVESVVWKPSQRDVPLKRFLNNGTILAIPKKSLPVLEKWMKKPPHLYLVQQKRLPI